MRHLEVEELWLQQELHRGKLRVTKVQGVHNTADVGTKAVSQEASDHYMRKMGFIYVEENREDLQGASKREDEDKEMPKAQGSTPHMAQEAGKRSGDKKTVCFNPKIEVKKIPGRDRYPNHYDTSGAHTLSNKMNMKPYGWSDWQSNFGWKPRSYRN